MKKIFLILFLSSLSSAIGQDMYKVVYDYTDITAQKFESVLYTNNEEAVYKIYDTRERGMKDLSTGEVIFVENDELSKFFYSNATTTYFRTTSYGEEILYQDNYRDKLDWKINTQNKKKIGKYNCTEAKIQINQRAYTVWFTFEVPLKYGPLKLHGLPGMILEVIENTGFLKISLNSLTKINDVKEFDFCKNYFSNKKKILTYKEYESRVIDDEVASLERAFAYIKQKNLEGNNLTMSYDYRKFADKYLEYPSNLLSEIKKVR